MNYKLIPDFTIHPELGSMSSVCKENDLSTFHQLCDFIYELPYGRNPDKTRLETVFTDGCGTCSTKHALLKQVAEEQGQTDIRLILSLFKMNAVNTPKVAEVLNVYQLDYIPEAHNYLKYQGEIIDLTGPGFDPAVYGNDILSEVDILTSQITDYKVQYHKEFLSAWLDSESRVSMDEQALWNARELCIEALSGK